MYNKLAAPEGLLNNRFWWAYTECINLQRTLMQRNTVQAICAKDSVKFDCSALLPKPIPKSPPLKNIILGQSTSSFQLFESNISLLYSIETLTLQIPSNLKIIFKLYCFIFWCNKRLLNIVLFILLYCYIVFVVLLYCIVVLLYWNRHKKRLASELLNISGLSQYSAYI